MVNVLPFHSHSSSLWVYVFFFKHFHPRSRQHNRKKIRKNAKEKITVSQTNLCVLSVGLSEWNVLGCDLCDTTNYISKEVNTPTTTPFGCYLCALCAIYWEDILLFLRHVFFRFRKPCCLCSLINSLSLHLMRLIKWPKGWSAIVFR